MTFSVGDFVSVRITRIDRPSTDFHRVLCIVVDKLGKNFTFTISGMLCIMHSTTLVTVVPAFRFRCAHGVLQTCYGEGDVETFQVQLQLQVEVWKNDRVLSL